MSLFTELKRRNVFRVGLFYLVAAWLVVQVAETLLPVFDVPETAIRIIVLILVLGLPLALVFSWIFELTPEGLKLDKNAQADPATKQQTAHKLNLATLIAAVLAIGLLVVDRLMPEAPRELPQIAAPANQPESIETPDVPFEPSDEPAAGSIAVLPFEDLSPEGDQQYFSDGISEEILNVLADVDGLKVASRTSSFLFRDQAQPIPVIARSLGVAHVVEGSVRKSGMRIRITAQLIEAESDAHLWSETYDRELNADNLFAIQDDIANAIVAALGRAMDFGTDTRIAVAPSTENLDAYELYLKAREMFRDRSDLPQAFALFERAIELDPGFARAWEGMAAVGIVARGWGHVDRPYDELAITAADRALALDPALSMPWAVRAYHEASFKRPVDFAEVLGLYGRALDLDPNNTTALLWRSISKMDLGFFDRALMDQERCLDIDPAYENCRRFMALTLLFAGRVDESLEAFLTGVENGFIYNRAMSFVRPLLDQGRKATVMLLMATDELLTALHPTILEFYRTGTPPSNAEEIAKDSTEFDRWDVEIYLYLGAYDLAAEAEVIGESALVFWDPLLPGLRSSDAFKRILNRIGAPAYWREHGFPPQCRPVVSDSGEDDFECD